MVNMLNQLIKDFSQLTNPSKAQVLQRFFKTQKGEYGEGDIFLGIPVPKQRELAKKYKTIPMEEIQKLLNSKIHEHILTALLILIQQFKKANQEDKEQILKFYLNNTKNINNWDLVDLSAPNIIGDFLADKDKSVLYNLTSSDNLWKKRIAIISTFSFIKNNQFQDTISLAEILLTEKHDLLHKAVGWMLREIGKKDITQLARFLDKHHKIMPRTMLRYAIEKLPENERQGYLKSDFGVLKGISRYTRKDRMEDRR